MENKLFYPDGDEVKVGDIIWVNEGINVRKVTEIVANKRLAKYKYGLDGLGLFWSRFIGQKDYQSNIELGIGGFEAQRNFESEGVGKLSSVELLALEMIYKLFEQQTNIKISSGEILFYPIYYPEEISLNNFRFYWYLLISLGYPPSYETEKCYKFNDDTLLFQEVSSSMREQIRTF